MKNWYNKFINTKVKKISFFIFVLSLIIMTIILIMSNKINIELEEMIEKVSKFYDVNNIEKINCDIIFDECKLYGISKGKTKEDNLYIKELNIYGIRDIITFASDMADKKPVLKTKIVLKDIRKKKNGNSIFSEYFPKNSEILKKNSNNLNFVFNFTFDFRNNDKKENDIYLEYLVQLENELDVKGEIKFQILEDVKQLKKEIDLNKIYFIVSTIELIGKDNYIPDMKYYFYKVDLDRVGATNKLVNKVYFNIDNDKALSREEFENENRIYFNSKEFENSESKTLIKNLTRENVLSFLLDKESKTKLIIKNSSKKSLKKLNEEYNKNPLTILNNFTFLVK